METFLLSFAVKAAVEVIVLNDQLHSNRNGGRKHQYLAVLVSVSDVFHLNTFFNLMVSIKYRCQKYVISILLL